MLALRGVDGAPEREVGRVALAVRSAEVEAYEGGLEGDVCGGFVDFLEVERGDDCGSGLVKVVSRRKYQISGAVSIQT